MNWYRQRNGGCWLALFAMALQFSFAFGHIHIPQYHVDGKMLLAVEAMLAKVPSHHAGCQNHSSHDHPVHQENDDQEETDSDICWTLNAASTLVLPVIANITWHFNAFDKHRIVKNTAIRSTIVFQTYQARAPPIVSFA